MFFLGVDLGTSALKAVLVDADQVVLARASVALSTARPRLGWSEQDPEDWWRAFSEAIAHLRALRPDALAEVRAVGLAGQMHGAVLLDRSGAVIRPAILWNDARSSAECDHLQAALPDLASVAGVGAMPGFTAPKLLWLRQHEPSNFAQIRKVLSPKDFLRYRLTGEIATDMSDAAGTLWFDQAARDWSVPTLAATGLSRAEMPILLEGTDTSGVITAEIAANWGMSGRVAVAGGAGDAAAAAVGIGAVEDRDAFLSLGTSAQFFVTDAAYTPQPQANLHAFAHALPGRWFRMAAMLNGASCLEWAAALVGAADISALLREVEVGFRGPSRLLFLPYLHGERTPHNDPAARGVFFGLDAGSGPADLIQATLEGVAYSFMDAQRCFAAAGTRPGVVAAVGGGARSAFWMRIMSYALGVPVVRYGDAEAGPAFGAARLARMMLTGEPPGKVCIKPRIVDVAEPDLELHSLYAERFAAYQRLYQSLKGEFRRIPQAGPGPA